VAVSIPDTPTLLPVRVRGDGQLCGLVDVSDPNNCSSTSPTLTCIDHAGQVGTVAVPQLQGGSDEGGGKLSELIAARSGETIFFGGPAPCGDASGAAGFGVGTRDGGLTFVSGAAQQLPAGYVDCEYAEIYPVLPTGDGSFVLMPQLYCHTAAGGGQVSYQQPVLLLGPDGGAPSVASVLPGVYEYPPDQQLGGSPSFSMPRDLVRGDAGVAVLTLTSRYSRALVALGPDLQPKWIYRYPRLVVFPTDLRLYALDDSGPLYLVDSSNQRVVAIER
jgi:hypothetical protein